MITVTIVGESAAEVGQKLLALSKQFLTSPAAPAEVETPRAAKPAVEKVKEEKPKEVKKEEKPKEAVKKGEPQSAEKVGVQAVSDKLAEVVSSKGKEEAKKLLAKFGAKRGGELKETDYAKFIADANALLSPPTEEAAEDEGLM